jgi:hypothetical protein
MWKPRCIVVLPTAHKLTPKLRTGLERLYWRVLSSGMWDRVVWQFADVSEKHTASICSIALAFHLSPDGLFVYPEHRSSTFLRNVGLRGVTSHRTSTQAGNISKCSNFVWGVPTEVRYNAVHCARISPTFRINILPSHLQGQWLRSSCLAQYED